MRHKSCRVDLTGIFFSELGDIMRNESESVPSRGVFGDKRGICGL